MEVKVPKSAKIFLRVPYLEKVLRTVLYAFHQFLKYYKIHYYYLQNEYIYGIATLTWIGRIRWAHLLIL